MLIAIDEGCFMLWNDYTKVLLSLSLAAWFTNLGAIFMLLSAGLAMILGGFTIAYFLKQRKLRDESVVRRMQVAWICIAFAFTSGYLIA